MQRNEVITIVERICKGLPWDPNQKYDELTETRDGAIRERELLPGVVRVKWKGKKD